MSKVLLDARTLRPAAPAKGEQIYQVVKTDEKTGKSRTIERKRIVPKGNVRSMMQRGDAKGLAALGFALGERAPVPDGKISTGSKFERQQGKIVEIHQLADAPAVPAPRARTIDEKLADAGLTRADILAIVAEGKQ